MKSIIGLLLVTISSPGLVAAQELSGGVTLGYGKHDIAGQNLDTVSLDGRVNLAFTNGITLGLTAGYLDLGIDGTSTDLTADFYGLDVGYRFSNGFSVGAYAEQLNGSISGLPIDLSLKTIGAEVGYTLSNVEFGAHYGRSSTSPDADIDIDELGLTVKYAAMPSLDIAGAFLRTTLSSGGTDIDVDTLGLAAAYDVNEQFSVFGGVMRTSIDDADVDFTTLGLGVGYDLSQMTGMGAIVSMEVAQTEVSLGGSSEDLDTVRLGLTFPLGGKGSEAPMNSVADSIFNPRHSGINAALTGAF